MQKQIENINDLPDEILYQIASNNLEIASKLIFHGIPFRLVLKNNNDWDKPLPEHIMKNFPDILPLDIKDDTLDRITFSDELGTFIISTKFGEIYYSKPLDLHDIVACVINDTPLSINESLTREDNRVLPLYNLSTEERIQDINEETGISKEYLVNSYAILRDELKEQ